MPAHSSSLTNHSAEVYRKNASFVYSDEAAGPILQILNAQQGERIVDLGCGSGELTLQLSQIVGSSGAILAVDSSPDMVEKAKFHTATTANITVLLPIDIQSVPTPLPAAIEEHSYDAIFSNAVLHWCKRDPAGVLKGCKRLLKQDGKGRLIIEMGGHMNMIGVRAAIHAVLRRRGMSPRALDPWFFPTPDEYRQLLVEAGFHPISLELVPRPTPLPTDLMGWLNTFASDSFLSALSDTEANAVMQEVAHECEVDCMDSRGRWTTMYVRLRIAATT